MRNVSVGDRFTIPGLPSLPYEVRDVYCDEKEEGGEVVECTRKHCLHQLAAIPVEDLGKDVSTRTFDWNLRDADKLDWCFPLPTQDAQSPDFEKFTRRTATGSALTTSSPENRTMLVQATPPSYEYRVLSFRYLSSLQKNLGSAAHAGWEVFQAPVAFDDKLVMVLRRVRP